MKSLVLAFALLLLPKVHAQAGQDLICYNDQRPGWELSIQESGFDMEPVTVLTLSVGGKILFAQSAKPVGVPAISTERATQYAGKTFKVLVIEHREPGIHSVDAIVNIRRLKIKNEVFSCVVGK